MRSIPLEARRTPPLGRADVAKLLASSSWAPSHLRWGQGQIRAPRLPAPESLLIFRGRQAEAAFKVPVKVALIDEPHCGGSLRNGLAVLEQSARQPDAISDLKCMWR